MRAPSGRSLASLVRHLHPSSLLSSSAAGFSLSRRTHESRGSRPHAIVRARPTPPPPPPLRAVRRDNAPAIQQRRKGDAAALGTMIDNDGRAHAGRRNQKEEGGFRALSISLLLRYSFHESCCAAASSGLYTVTSAICHASGSCSARRFCRGFLVFLLLLSEDLTAMAETSYLYY